jgi:Na+-transporting NADH:ubiquinone oxidoreductase subunit D
VDAFGNGVGYSVILIVLGGIRELFGRGQLFGWQVLPLADAGGWFTPLSLMLLAPSAFFLLGGVVWAVRSLLPEQAEAPERVPPTTVRAAE